MKRNSAREFLDDRPLKRKCLSTFIDEDDMVWLKDELGDIRKGITEITEHLEGVDKKLGEFIIEY